MAKAEKEILRTVNVEGELFVAGDEDALVEALEALEDQDEDFNSKDELARLTRKGYLVGFTTVDDDELEGGNSDQIANRGRSKASAVVQKLAAKSGSKAPKRKAKVQKPNKNNPGTSTSEGDEADDANTAEE